MRPFLPKRLIEVSGDVIRLVHIEDQIDSEYTTLSHCWGSDQNVLKTSKDNIEELQTGITWMELPSVFRDAIELTRSLGCNWIWIDSLCIVQDCEAEWRDQSRKMADIYSNSFLNIAATSSRDGTGSCFTKRYWAKYPFSERPVESHVLKSQTACEERAVHVREMHLSTHRYVTGISSSMHEAPLLDRAWVLQERLLAPRTLHFAHSEMVWECSSTFACECRGIDHMCIESEHEDPSETLKQGFMKICRGEASNSEALNLWLHIVIHYAELKLTRISDRPYALAGIAACIKRATHMNYTAGMWWEDMPRTLMWRPTATFDPDTDVLRTQERSCSLAPSWSWMSQHRTPGSQCSIAYGPVYLDGFVHSQLVQIHQIHAEYASEEDDPFGQVLYAQITLTAPVRSGRLMEFHLLTESRHLYQTLKLDDHIGEEIVKFSADGLAPGQELGHHPFLCVMMGTGDTSSAVDGVEHFLVLQLASPSDHYTRIGIGVHSWRQEESFCQQYPDSLSSSLFGRSTAQRIALR